MTGVRVNSDDVEEIVPRGTQGNYRIRIEDNPVRLHHDPQEIETAGVTYPDGFQGTLSDLRGEAVYAVATTGTSRIEIDDATFRLVDGVFTKLTEGSTAITDSSGNTIDPATEATLSNVATSLDSRTGLDYGEEIVATAGTAEPLNGGTALAIPRGESVLIQALSSNTGDIYVGDGTVSAADGYPLAAGQTVSLQVDDVSTINVDADVGGEGVRWIVEI